MTMSYRDSYHKWCQNPLLDKDLQQELADIAADEDAIKERFYRDLEFGTGGLRGVMGAGTNRMNLYTVKRATQGLAEYILEQGGAHKGVAIAFDSRHKSKEFAYAAAACLNGNGIRSYLFSRLAPTPLLSYAVRKKGCIAGIVITASHNPAEYNGYKVYWEDGAQITAPKDKEIMARVTAVADDSQVKSMRQAKAEAEGLFHLLGDQLLKAYLDELETAILDPEVRAGKASALTVVYTPLHGTGNRPVQQMLKRMGMTRLYIVREQKEPDGDFPTVSSPNPENPEAFTMALSLAGKVDADLILATDPDADRLGAYVKDKETGEYHPLTGNMTGVLLCHYLLSQRRARGILPENGAVVKTIVTTPMAAAIAADFGVQLIDVLTGFKYIGEQMKLFEQDGTYSYQFGFEESYGCLVESCVRDKDAVSAVMSLCEAAAYYEARGSSLWQQMQRLYERYGYFKEGLATRTMEGMAGAEQVRMLMENLRANQPEKLAELEVLEIADYKAGLIYNRYDGRISPSGLPHADVIRYQLSNGAWCCIRPSGTEPKIKYYFGVKETTAEKAEASLKQLKAEVLKLGRL